VSPGDPAIRDTPDRRPTGPQPTSEQPARNQPARNQPARNQPASKHHPASDQRTADRRATGAGPRFAPYPIGRAHRAGNADSDTVGGDDPSPGFSQPHNSQPNQEVTA
jgi:hypothetical protein